MLFLCAGHWKEGLREGKGTFKYPNGDWYKGDWLGGMKFGTGTYFSFEGSCWVNCISFLPVLFYFYKSCVVKR